MRAALVLCFFLSAVSTAVAAIWPEVRSDLPVDPALRLGVLPNGLRYAILPNPEPRNRVSLRLLVLAGSQDEREEERGLAHFVEHMAFRGSRSHPAGSMVTALQRLGMGLGPDNTAFTAFDHTIYHLELPDATEVSLREGLDVFREYAEEVSFDTALIEKERGVILSENATRDTPAARMNNAHLEFLWPDARLNKRLPGGTTETVRSVTREQFVAFYNAWYRPDRVAVIVVGDLAPELAERLVATQLGQLKPRGPARVEPTDLVPPSATPPTVGVFSDPGFIGMQIMIEHPRSRPRADDTHARRTQALHEAIAFTMLQSRLGKIAHEPEAAFITPLALLMTPVRDWQVASIGAAGKSNDWHKVAAEVEREHRRAFQFGFTAPELAETKAAITTLYEEGVRMAATRRSESLATQLAGCLLTGTAFVTPQDAQRDMIAELAATTLDDCLREFRTAWTTTAPHVFVAANSSFDVTRHEIAAALNASRDEEVQPRKERPAVVFAYDHFGEPGRLRRDDYLADLDAHLAAFENGVLCNFKPTKFAADAIEVRVRVGDGRLSQPADKPGLDLLANAVVLAGGLGHHTQQELSSVLAGHFVSLGFAVEDEASWFTVGCSRRDLPLALRIVAAYLTDSAFRPEAMREATATLNTMFMNLATAPSGPITLVAPRDVAGGDRRFGVALPSEVAVRTLEEVKAWLDPQLKHGAIELSVVGDATWEEVSAAVAHSIGALSPRATRPAGNAAALALAPPRASITPRVFPMDPTVKLAAISWYCTVPPPKDTREVRRCSLLAYVLTERLRTRVRDELGAAYSTATTFVDHDAFPQLDYFLLWAEVAPAQLNQALAIFERELQSLAFKGVGEDEFARAKAPYLHDMDDYLRSNSYWGGTVLSDIQQRPMRITNARDRSADNASITREELSALAKKYFDTPNAFKFMVAPPQGSPIARLNDSTAGAAALTVGDAQPVPLYQVRPNYPSVMLNQRGEAVVDFIVAPDGSVQNAKALKQTNEAFGQAAVDSVKKWKFKPGLKNGKPVPTHLQVPIIFEPNAPH